MFSFVEAVRRFALWVHDLFIGLRPLALNYTNCPLEIALNWTLGFESPLPVG